MGINPLFDLIDVGPISFPIHVTAKHHQSACFLQPNVFSLSLSLIPCVPSSPRKHQAPCHSPLSLHQTIHFPATTGDFSSIRGTREKVSANKRVQSLEDLLTKVGGAMLSSKEMMAFKSYQSQAELFVKEYLLADPLIPYTSIFGGIFTCKMVYDLTQLISTVYFKSYSSLSKIQRIEWNNRAISTVHAIFITTMSLYFVFCSSLYSENQFTDLTVRTSPLSTFGLGISVGYFIVDLGMIFWFYPFLGGYEYVIHHLISLVAVAYAMLSGEGQLYTYMVLVSETTTPGINLRWYLDAAGMKRSRAYLVNGVVIFFAWLVARILLFIYMFYHVYLHFDQVKRMHTMGQLLVLLVPVVLAIMNLAWFSKIIKGLRKTLAKRQ